MIKTKSIYMPALKEDGHRILITRYYPRGIKKTHFDEWIRDLAPSADLLKSYKAGKVSWDDFKKNFLTQIKSSAKSTKMLDMLVKAATQKHVTLLCHEKEGDHCHRYLIEGIIKAKIRNTTA